MSSMTIEATRRQELYDLLGDLPSRSQPIDVQRIGEDERDGYVLERLVLNLNGIEGVPAYFVRPKDRQEPLPVIFYNHAHGGDYNLGKDELLDGRNVLQRPPYADALTSLGYAALCIDTWAFGERRGRSEGEIFREMLWSGQVMWGMMVFDSLRARLSREPPGCRFHAHRYAGAVDGQHHGVVAGGPRYARQGLHRHLLPHGLRGAHCAPFAGGAQRLLLRAETTQAFHDGADQCADRSSPPPQPSRNLRPSYTAGRFGPYRRRVAEGLHGRRRNRGLAALPLRHRPHGNSRDASGDHRLSATVAVSPNGEDSEDCEGYERQTPHGDVLLRPVSCASR